MKHLELQVHYWRQSAQRNLATAASLFKTHHRDACLFFCHLALEKLLKGLVVRETRQFAPHIHDLAKLSELAAVALTVQQRQSLRTITTFNIAGRYDEIKFAFYKQCTPRFTKKYFTITNELFVCLKDEYQKK